MGHSQSKSRSQKYQSTSNYGPGSSSHLQTSTSSSRSGKSSPKNKPKSSSKDKHSRSYQQPSVHVPQHNPSTYTPPRTSSSYSSSITTTSTHNRPSYEQQHHQQQRVSHSGGYSGERSAPSRQFSLTRQTSSGTSAKHSQIEKYFTKYKDKGEDAILAEGMEKFCVDLGVDPTEFIVLVLAWKFNASQMCRFTREEFMNGCQKMCAHDAKSLKERFPELLVEARDGKNFKELYNFTFSFGLDHTTGQRSLPIDMAVPLWQLVFNQNKPEILDRWFEYLQSSDVRGISRDTWNMFLPFVNSIKPDLSNYDESEAWPSLFDDFVEAELEKA